MMRDLIKKDILKLNSRSKSKLKTENKISNSDIEKILDEAIEETEQCFGKTLKQLPPKGEAYDFLIEMSKTLLEEADRKSNIKNLVNSFCKSDKSYKEFFKELDVSGDLGDINRGDLYDSTMVMINNSVSSQNISNLDNDDKDKDVVWNTQAKNLYTKNVDWLNSPDNVGDSGITSGEYFNKTKKSKDTPDSDLGYEVTQSVKFHRQDSDEQQEGEIIGFSNSDDPSIKKLVKIKVNKGSDAGKIIDVRIHNIKGRLNKDIKNLTDEG